MDIATHLITSELRRLADRIDEEEYGSDVDFDNESFLSDLEDGVVMPLKGEIIY